MRKFWIVLVLGGVFLNGLHETVAQEKNPSLLSKGEYFSVYAYEGLETNELLSRINFKYFMQTNILSTGPSENSEATLAKTMDALFLEVSDVLGIHMYDFQGEIRIYPDKIALNEVFKSFYGQDFPEASFYVHEHKTIYISFADLTLGMLGHEIAHMIQSSYFVVPPPPKVQEILSGYVEYSLMKNMMTRSNVDENLTTGVP